MNKWRDVDMEFTVELCRESKWVDYTHDKALPASLLAELDRLVPADCDNLKLYFDVRSSGFYHPAVRYLRHGDPGYPEEYDDERKVKGVYLLRKPEDRSGYIRGPRLSKPVADELGALYQKEIQAVELPSLERD